MDRPATTIPLPGGATIARESALSEEVKVYRRVKKAIVCGQYAPGSWMPEAQLSQVLSVDRVLVRDALDRLHREGFIDLVPGKGAMVVELSDVLLDELFEARAAIETTFFERAAARLTRSQVEGLRLALQAEEEIMTHYRDDPELWHEARMRYLKSDRAFHDALVGAAGNHCWLGFYHTIRDRIEIYGNQVSLDPEWFPVAIADHHAIIDAILAQDYQAGRQAMARHITHIRSGISSGRRNRIAVVQDRSQTP
jgi:DNA-binding GntR family transcriptional regulator